MSYPDFLGKSLTEIENDLRWKGLVKTTGDLNSDGVDDHAVVLESRDSIPEKRCSDCNLLKSKPRIIIVLINRDGKQMVEIQNNRFIGRGNEGGMLPYLEPELFIHNEMLTICYQFTRSKISYVFKYSDDTMVLVKAKSGGVHSASGDFEQTSFDFKKGEIISETGNISNIKIQKERIKTNIKSKTLSEFGPMMEWEVIENKFL
ncbi:MAG: hypothetical protein WBG71_14665 [Leeuwenhoekiella sp.]